MLYIRTLYILSVSFVFVASMQSNQQLESNRAYVVIASRISDKSLIIFFFLFVRLQLCIIYYLLICTHAHKY